jgi:hypothetical protein
MKSPRWLQAFRARPAVEWNRPKDEAGANLPSHQYISLYMVAGMCPFDPLRRLGAA